MKTLAKQYGVVFLVGLVALSAALATSMITAGTLLSSAPFISALRMFGIGLIAAGMALWITLRREEAGKGGLTTLFGFLVIAGVVLLILGLVFFSSGLSQPANLAGLGFTLAALAVGVLSMIFAPAYPRPLAKRWPVGAEAVLTRFANLEDDAHGHEAHAHDEGHGEERAEPEAAGAQPAHQA